MAKTPSITPGLMESTPSKFSARKRSAKETEMRKRAMISQRQKEYSASARDIGLIPDPEDPRRRAQAEKELKVFATTYFQHIFFKEFSETHDQLFAAIEDTIRHGGLQALATPRGTGKDLALDTPIPTIDGWSTMGDLKPGDTIFDEKVHPCTVLAKSEVFTDHDCYMLYVTGGERITAGAGHLWTVLFDVEIAGEMVTMERTYSTKGIYNALEEWPHMQFRFPYDPRRIEKVIKVPTVPTQCIQVSSPSSLFLCGRKMVPTHNSVICQVGALWALFTAQKFFVMLLGATEREAQDQLADIKAELQFNELLAADFPEICFPIVQLEGVAHRCRGQTANGGDHTFITWSADEVVLPTVQGSTASGSILRVAGITGSVRGAKKTIPERGSVRPDYVLLDDIQTAESSRSTAQCIARLKVVNSDVLGLAGPGEKISAIMPCTVITKGDVADTILDRELNPDWRGIRIPMLITEPTNLTLWDEYGEIRADGLRMDQGTKAATDFYIKNRKEMDKGATIYWPARYEEDEISAIQHAMNLKLRNNQSFQAEYQNNPLSDDRDLTDHQLTPEDFLDRLSNLPKGTIPQDHEYLAAYIDVQKDILFYTIVSANIHFGIHVVEYGTYPDQRVSQFDLSDLRYTLTARYKKSLEANLHSGLTTLVNDLASRAYERADGAQMYLGQILIDAAWGESTDTIRTFCRTSPHAALLIPSFGRGITAARKPMNQWPKRASERIYHHCVHTRQAHQEHITLDTNYWKTFLYTRITSPKGEKTGFSLFGTDRTNHDLYIQHCTAQYFTNTAGQGRTLKEWAIRPDKRRDDWWDCTVGATVALHLTGAQMEDWDHQPIRRPISLSSLTKGDEQPTPEPRQAITPKPTKTDPVSLSALQKRK